MNLSIKELNELIYSLGITASKGIMCDKELNVSLLNKLYDELNSKIAEEAEYGLTSHLVSNEEADEDASLHMLTSFRIADPFTSEYKRKGVTQAILDFVEMQGDATHTEMHDFYRKTFGSNSFSHILRNLIVPYKNRPTRRYLVKTDGGNYVVKVANPSNWVVIDY
jgi:hypothetical protein